MAEFGLSKTVAGDSKVRGLIDKFKSNRSKLTEARRDLEQLDPVVAGAHPVRLSLGIQGGAYIAGVGRELLPESPVVDGAQAATALTLLCVGGWMGRPDVVGLGNGIGAPLSFGLGRATVRRARAAMGGNPAPTDTDTDTDNAAASDAA